MDFSETLKGMINQGWDASKDILAKAGEKAKELGTLGVIFMEIQQLKAQARSLTAALGAQVYASLVEAKEASLTAESPAIKENLQKLDLVRKEIAAREAEFTSKGGKESDLGEA